ncbi:Phytanoyl-CoA dioxygenase (PhyH) [Symmachiella dynata]|uniref:Ectoine hydroxylase n=1 Tax=Symmachiella dynata TaxID=2527995 RepID=A0A517ZXX7_9PLAN|nr:ectoine hydroxylase [Symmachiella dynata]QDU47327.1 Phytanoyl-CoA dioxygenase (PhyH) [Symmachiella dynata]
METTPPHSIDAREDCYPSRVQPEPEFLKRCDPIVYNHEAPGPLSAAQLSQFERDGFLILPAFFPEADIATYKEEIQRLGASDEIQQRPESILEPDHCELRSLFSVHKPEISPCFSEVAADPRIAGMAAQILDDDVYIHQSRVNLKPGFAGKEFYWHSDFETWHVEDGMPRMRAVSCSLLLTENYEFNGPLMLIPGSHCQFVACVGETPDDHYQKSLRRQEYGVPDQDSLARLAEDGGIVNVVGPPGTIVLFDCNTMHGSNGNITPFPRSNLFFVYNSLKNRLVEPFCSKKPRPEFIANRTAVAPLTMRELNVQSHA